MDVSSFFDQIMFVFNKKEERDKALKLFEGYPLEPENDTKLFVDADIADVFILRLVRCGYIGDFHVVIGKQKGDH